jgi:HAE1 family hydrophobic/amphiphilic exporter-1
MVLVLITALLAVFFAMRVPGGFLPDEDEGYFFANVQLPDASSLERTDATVKKVQEIIQAQAGVEYVTGITGFSMLSGAYASNTAFFFVSLKPWEERKAKAEQAAAIIQAINGRLQKEVTEAFAFTFAPPPIPGLGSGSGFTMMIQDQAGQTPQALAEALQKFMVAAKARPEIGSINSIYRAAVPQVLADLDRDKAVKLGVPVTTSTTSTASDAPTR